MGKRYDYIVLDGTNATLDSSEEELTWLTGDYLFKQYKNQDDIFLSLYTCQFIGTYITEHLTSTMYSGEVLCNIRGQNINSTNSENLLSIVNTLDDQTNLRISNATAYVDKPLRIKFGGKLTEITIKIRHQGEFLNFGTVADNVNKSYCKFVLKVEYEGDDGV
tara:strand:+ start:947 stop:1435 length:489 start_codon:yes stop_codon:yes gene_type:complete